MFSDMSGGEEACLVIILENKFRKPQNKKCQ